MKQADSFALFTESRRLFAGSSYDVQVDAPEFREDTVSGATLTLCSGQVRLASCALVPDPLRRGLRVSGQAAPLAVPAYAETAPLELRVELGGNTILALAATVAGAVSGDAAPPSDTSRWTVTDLGTVLAGAVSVADMSQTKLSASPMAEPLSVTPPEGPLDAYVVVTVPQSVAAPRFPFSGVLVGGSAPVWSHQDSLLLPARKWILRIVRVADDYCADLRAGRPGGTEIDPDGTAVVSAEVNS